MERWWLRLGRILEIGAICCNKIVMIRWSDLSHQWKLDDKTEKSRRRRKEKKRKIKKTKEEKNKRK